VTYPIKGIVVCVGYDDLLAITLRRNMRHLTECLVVTHPGDAATLELAASCPDVRTHVTDAFYRGGASFNKGAAMEEGFDTLGREGWIVVWDADTLFPDVVRLPRLTKGFLYSPPRLIQANPAIAASRLDVAWNTAQPTVEDCHAGYFQLFHADDEALRERPWYDVTYVHAGGCDHYFQAKWPRQNKIRPGFSVLHLGPRDQNWFGRATARLDGRLSQGREQKLSLMRQLGESRGWFGRPGTGAMNEKVCTEGSDT
jgi:hypothetical protein